MTRRRVPLLAACLLLGAPATPLVMTHRMPAGRLLVAAVLLSLAGPGAAGCTDGGCWTNGYEFDNATSTTISVVFRAADGSEAVIQPAIPPGVPLAAGSGVGCGAAGTLIARDPSGRELARQEKPAAETYHTWVIAEKGPIPATIVNGLGMIVQRIEFTGRSGPPVVVARDLAPGARASLDAASLGDPSIMCWGHLDVYIERQGLPAGTHSITTCAAWNWTVSLSTPLPTYP